MVSFYATKVIKKYHRATKNDHLIVFFMKKLSLTEHYEAAKASPSPCQQLVSKLAKLTNRSEETVIKWLRGKTIPEVNTQKILSDYFDTPVEDLFPEKYRKNNEKQ